jgi:hypothetical protein
MIDIQTQQAEASIRQVPAMAWKRTIPGHPGVGGRLPFVARRYCGLRGRAT